MKKDLASANIELRMTLLVVMSHVSWTPMAQTSFETFHGSDVCKNERSCACVVSEEINVRCCCQSQRMGSKIMKIAESFLCLCTVPPAGEAIVG